MKSTIAWILVVVAVAAVAGGAFWAGRRTAPDNAPPPEKKEPGPTATVGVVPVRKGMISEWITAYGPVVAPPAETRVVSVPFESRVTKVLVAPGQTLAAGQPTVEVEGSAATALALEEARNAADAADRDLQLVKKRYDQKLATNADLNTAQTALQTAQARLKSLQQGGAGGPRQLKADAPGVVSKVDVQLGQVVPIGGPLVEIAANDRIEVRLGMEPSDLPFLKPGQPVRLSRTDDATGESIEGQIRLIGQRLDPTTRLADVMVSLPPGARLLLESFVVAKTARTTATGLIVPRDAVLPGEGGPTLFTVTDGKAVKHTVKTGIENDQEVQIIADDVAEGDAAVVVGNAELQDGMAVKVQEATAPQPVETQPAATQPTETQPASSQPAQTQPAEPRPAGTQPSAVFPWHGRPARGGGVPASESRGLNTKATETTKSTEVMRSRPASVRFFVFPLWGGCATYCFFDRGTGRSSRDTATHGRAAHATQGRDAATEGRA
ncbi:MAG TPA: efflux RND transporter periplasmic adaptor subunit [Tepidisphaeraceae bacterium]|jgi:RND family efflux transporter MFP subunit|nr:efflux RND transporter periplasmic adaptor subunit [Tepidisphaeraceae bacterium]